MFEKIEYKLLIENYMTKDEYKQLIDKYMDIYDISYINAKNKICLEQMKNLKKILIQHMKKHLYKNIMI